MNNKRLMARMGNGLLREVRDSAEAEKIRRETGDEDMFVFYEDKHSRSRTEQPRSTWERPKASDSRKTTVNKQTLLQRGILPMEQNQAEAGLDTSWRTPDFNPHAKEKNALNTRELPPWAQTTVAIPKSKQTRGLPPGVKNTAADPGPLVGPLTGHAAATLNPDGSTQIRLLDQGADPKVPVNKSGKSKAYNPIKDMTQRLHKIGAKHSTSASQKYPSQEHIDAIFADQEKRDKAYRESRKWLDEQGQEKARKEMEPTAKVVGKVAKWGIDEAAQIAAERWLQMLAGPEAALVLEILNQIHSIGEFALTPSELGDSTLQEGWEKEYEKKNE